MKIKKHFLTEGECATFSTEGDCAHSQVALRGYGHSILGGIQKAYEHNAGHLAAGGRLCLNRDFGQDDLRRFLLTSAFL